MSFIPFLDPAGFPGAALLHLGQNALMKSLCVFCGSSSGNRPAYAALAAAAGALIARRGLTLVYGGGRVGLMGAGSTLLNVQLLLTAFERALRGDGYEVSVAASGSFALTQLEADRFKHAQPFRSARLHGAQRGRSGAVARRQ